MENIRSRKIIKIILRWALVDTIAEQPDLESKDCHPQMKIRKISI